jgi:FkbH-like protein
MDFSRLSFVDYLRQLPELRKAASGQPLRIAILRSYTVEPIEPVLSVRLLLDGFTPTIWFGGFNQYVQEVLDNQSELYRFQPDVVLLLARLDELVPAFVDDFAGTTPAEWDQQLAAKARELAHLAGRVAARTSAQVIIQNASLSRLPYFGVVDAQQEDGQTHLIHRFNQTLTGAAVQTAGVFVWDFDGFVREIGTANLLDPKMWWVSRNPFRQAAYPALVGDLMRYLRSAVGRAKKCIVLDLDNTLWGGVAGEDGLEGIQLGHTYPGNCFRAFQQELLTLYNRGVLLAINSKNNESDAWEIIDGHPDMILRRQHFAATRINWQDKAANMRELARELNLGVDSFVYIDDNPAECELIRRECTGCDVVMLPDKPYLIPDIPSRLAGVENIRLTEEDRRKGDIYRAQAQRAEQQQQYSNLDDFLRSLEMEVSIEPAASFSIPRIAQLTQKTNQMNMTTRRYTEAQVQQLASAPASAVFSVAAKDRFGDHGIIGVFILKFTGDECRIDTFLLSCRVIGRRIEAAMMAWIADIARARGLRRITAEFIPTAKNQPAAGFYDTVGFRKIDETTFVGDIVDGMMPYPSTIALRGASKPASSVPIHS